MNSQDISAWGAVISAMVAVAAVVISLIVYRGQVRISLSIHQAQTLLSQRQLLIPLWDYMSTLQRIDPKSPIGPDVLKVVNTLELVALSVEGGMVDAQVIRRTFRTLYLDLYDQVAVCRNVPGTNRSGADLLRENPAAMAFYDELRQEHLNRDKLKR
jgi:hypothetical protein